MRIATLNLWNSDMPRRYPQLLEALHEADADVIALQECTEDFFSAALADTSDWPFRVFEAYEDEDEGLALLSRYPIRESRFLHRCPEYANAAALHTIIDAQSLTLSVTNVHLPWDSVISRERQAAAIQRFINGQDADYSLLLGDFNDGPDAGVGRFFSGMQPLEGVEAAPCWNDLAHTWSCHTGEPVPPTLDTVRNPRWTGCKSPYAPRVMDRIYLRDSWNEVSLEGVQLFGQKVSAQTGLAPSDHWGVWAELTLSSCT